MAPPAFIPSPTSPPMITIWLGRDGLGLEAAKLPQTIVVVIGGAVGSEGGGSDARPSNREHPHIFLTWKLRQTSYAKLEAAKLLQTIAVRWPFIKSLEHLHQKYFHRNFMASNTMASHSRLEEATWSKLSWFSLTWSLKEQGPMLVHQTWNIFTKNTFIFITDANCSILHLGAWIRKFGAGSEDLEEVGGWIRRGGSDARPSSLFSETSSPKILSSSLPRQIGPNYRAGHQLQILIFSLSYKLIKYTCYRLMVFKIVRWSDGDQSKMAVLWNIFIFSLQITRFRPSNRSNLFW